MTPLIIRLKARLEPIFGPESSAQLLQSFLTSLRQQLDAASTAIANNDPATLVTAAHSLKGIMSNAGEEQATQAAIWLHKAAMLGDTEEISQAWHAFLKSIDYKGEL
ncbi:MAG: Hpt domain-containing protein [Campylobacterales bacterium]